MLGIGRGYREARRPVESRSTAPKRFALVPMRYLDAKIAQQRIVYLLIGNAILEFWAAQAG